MINKNEIGSPYELGIKLEFTIGELPESVLPGVKDVYGNVRKMAGGEK